MKTILLGFLLMFAAVLPGRAAAPSLSLTPVPFELLLPSEITTQLSTSPLTGEWADQVKAQGATASTLVWYQPETGDETILFSAYYFPAAAWDAAQKPDEPPPFGQEVIRANGMVLSIAGPHDTIFDPETPDGRNVVKASELIYLPASFAPAP